MGSRCPAAWLWSSRLFPGTSEAWGPLLLLTLPLGLPVCWAFSVGGFGVFPESRRGQASNPHFGTRGMGTSGAWPCPQAHTGGFSQGTMHCLSWSNLLRKLFNKL